MLTERLIFATAASTVWLFLLRRFRGGRTLPPFRPARAKAVALLVEFAAVVLGALLETYTR